MELWHGYEKLTFTFEGREAYLVFPKEPMEGGHWSLKTEYWDVFPETEVALLARGFHAAHLTNLNKFATPEDCHAKARFVKYVSETYGLAPKCVPVGFSLGGAHAINFTGHYPDLVECMFIDAPVMNFCSYPARAEFAKAWNEEFVVAHPGMKRHLLWSFPHHPMNQIETLIAHRIPIVMLYGNEDLTVRYEENGKLLEEAYLDHPGLLTVVCRELQGHQPHGLMDRAGETADMILERLPH